MGDQVKIQKSYFDVLGICCPSEVPLIERILKPMAGIQKVSVIVPSRTVIVVHDTMQVSQLQIVKALNQARLEASIRSYDIDKIINKWPSPSVLFCGFFLVVSVFHIFFQPLKWVALAAVAVALPQIILRSYAAIQRFTLDINVLMLIAVGGAVALKDYLEAGFIVFLFIISEWLESMVSQKATTGMSLLMKMAPQKATLAETGEIIDVKEIKVNTILAVKAGEVIPIDGIVVEGSSEVDEKNLTGESIPVPKKPKSLVWAGTLNIDGYICVKTEALAEHSAVARMAMLVEEAQNNRSKTQRIIDSCAKYYTPAVVVIAAGVAVFPLILKADNMKYWFKLALVLLVSACPCALVLSTPVATFCSLLTAAKTGLLIKGGDVLEELAKTKLVAFDKTGTITRGEFSVMELQLLSYEINKNTLLSWISSLESKSSHPMASALVEYARFNSIEPKPQDVSDFQIYPGEGVSGVINGERIYIGNKRIVIRAGSAWEPDAHKMKEAVTHGYVLLGAILIGIFTLSDSCRTGAKEGIKELQSMGIKTAMLTGDSNIAALQAQKQLDHAIEEIHAELFPEDKVRIISDFKINKGSTVMIGDGLNDAPALAKANVGISMGISGSAIAMETSHVTLMSNDIRKIPKAIQLARRTQRKIIVNIVFSALTKIASLGLAIGGHPLLWAAVLADVGTCIIVILYSMTLLRTDKKTSKKCCQRSKFQRSACTGKGQCGSAGTCNGHDHSKNETKKDEKSCNRCCESCDSREYKKDLLHKCCNDKLTCKENAGHDHVISITTDENSHKDDSCQKHTHEFHTHKHKAEQNQHAYHGHCHHESESAHVHSGQKTYFNHEIVAHKNSCNACFDPTKGAEKKDAGSCCERQDFHEKRIHKANAGHEHLVSMTIKGNSHKDDSFHIHKDKAEYDQHAYYAHCHHESESAHVHSGPETACSHGIDAHKNCCNAHFDLTMEAEKKDASSCCESKRQNFHKKIDNSDVQFSMNKENATCCHCRNGMIQLPDIIVE